MIERVSQLIRRVAAEAILPRFRALQSDDIEEKSPGELVTTADREAEALLTIGLLELLPASAVLGEEAASVQSELYQRLTEETDLWLVRSGRANLNNSLGGNSGHKVRPWMAEQTGVFDGEEISAPHPAHAHARIQGTGGPCSFA